MSDQILVGDVGGTHARFAVVDVSVSPWQIGHALDLAEDFPNFAAALRSYLDRAGLPTMPKTIAIAVAGPVTAGTVTFTNRNWRISENELNELGFGDALLINDFAALAFAVTTLGPKDLHTIGPDLPGIEGETISILGAGTGFGASSLARFRGRAVPVATEGGHAGFAPSDEREIAVLQVLLRRFDHVSIERVLSGPGLENLHGALAELGDRKAERLSAAEIVAHASADVDCRDAVQMFCAIYGTVAGDFALTHGARGGVYLAGGIAQKIESILENSQFRARFESKGRLSGYVKSIPTRLILSGNTAFLGAARASLEFHSPNGGRLDHG
jgi:glucokinase